MDISGIFINVRKLMHWGDIDVHGFHIVSRLRGVFAHLRTAMMVTTTLRDCSYIVTTAKEAKYEEVVMLTAEEFEAYSEVKALQVLLEQEKIQKIKMRDELADRIYR